MEKPNHKEKSALKEIESIIRSVDMDELLKISLRLNNGLEQVPNIKWMINPHFSTPAGIVPNLDGSITLHLNIQRMLEDYTSSKNTYPKINKTEYILSIMCHEFSHISTRPKITKKIDLVEVNSGLDYRIYDADSKISIQSGAIINEGLTDFFGSVIFDRYIKAKGLEKIEYQKQYGILSDMTFGLFRLISRYSGVAENVVQESFFRSFFNNENLDIFSVYDVQDQSIESILRRFLSTSYSDINLESIQTLKRDLDLILEGDL